MNSLEAINYLKGAKYNWNFQGDYLHFFNEGIINEEFCTWADDLFKKGLVDKDWVILADDFVKGFPYKFAKALTDEEITVLSEKFPGNKIPSELKSILKITACVEDAGAVDGISFTSIGTHCYKFIFPYSVSVGHDGFANNWVLEITSEGELGAVFFCCHDPQVVFKHSENLSEYLNFVIKWNEASSLEEQDSFYENLYPIMWDVISNESHQYDITQFLKNNLHYKDFLSQFDSDEWIVFDLREAEVNEGFGVRDMRFLKKHDTDLVWVAKK